MANKRIKDLGTTASTLAADDYVAIDGNANGTRKIVKGDLVNDISTQVAGTYLDEANNLSDVASKDTSKLNLEVPDVGTAPNDVPTNGMLGSLAYQSADSVSVAELQVESTTGTATTQALTVTDGTDTNFVVREDGQTIVGGTTSSVSKFGSTAKGLTVSADTQPVLALNDTDNANYVGYIAQNGTDTYLENYTSGNLYLGTNATTAVTIDSSGKVGIGGSPTYELDVQAANARIAATSSAGVVNHLQADSTGAHVGPLSNHNLYFKTNNTTRWTVTAGGNLLSSGGGIDFGSTNTASGVTVNGSVMSEYEVGTWTPSFTTTGSGFTTPPTMDVFNARYVRVGDMVAFTCYVQTDSVDLTGAGTYLLLTGLPYAASASSGNNFSAVNVGFASRWVNAPAGGYIQSTAAFIYLAKRNTSAGGFSEMSPSDLTAGTTADQNRLMISGSYVIA